MSKSKPKDKKNQNGGTLQIQYEVQKRDILESNFTIKRLQQRLSMITQENIKLQEENQSIKIQYSEKFEELIIKNQTNQKRLDTLRQQKTQLQIDISYKQSKLRVLQKQLFDQQQLRIKQFEEYKKNVNFQISKYQSQLMEYKQFMNQKDSLEIDRANLRELYQVQKANKVRQVADKERQKVQATDKLRDQMLKKIRQMRTNLLSLKKQQLSTTTRLTILQNHQLTSQLEYQSKQTQKLIFKNQEMQIKINNYERDLEIHKEVQQQLAKRAHISKGIIRKLNIRITELQEELGKKYISQNKKGQLNINSAQSSKDNQLYTLNKNLQEVQKRYCQLKLKYQIQSKQKNQLKNHLSRYQDNCNNLYSMLQKYYFQILNSNIVIREDDEQINLEKLKVKEIQKWTQDQISLVVKTLLSSIRSYLPNNNLPTPYLKKNLLIPQYKQNSQKKNNQQILKPLDEVNKNRIQNLPVNVASKIVSSNLRQWGRTIDLSRDNKMRRKYKLNVSASYR